MQRSQHASSLRLVVVASCITLSTIPSVPALATAHLLPQEALALQQAVQVAVARDALHSGHGAAQHAEMHHIHQEGNHFQVHDNLAALLPCRASCMLHCKEAQPLAHQPPPFLSPPAHLRPVVAEEDVQGLAHAQQAVHLQLPNVVRAAHAARVVGRPLKVALQKRQWQED